MPRDPPGARQTPMCDATMQSALDFAFYGWVALGGLGTLVWTRDKARSTLARGDSEESDQ